MSFQSSEERDRFVAQECQRLLASPMFLRSPVLSRLLKFLADHKVRGRRVAPKAYAIATEALGRNSDFDPAVDSYPRVMVGRLRNLLDRYYDQADSHYRLRLPQGSYEIIVEERPSERVQSQPALDAGAAVPIRPRVTEDSTAGQAISSRPQALLKSHSRFAVSSRSWRRGALLVLALVALGLAAMAGWWASRTQEILGGDPLEPPPLLEITPPVAGNTDVSRAVARALAAKLRDGLYRFNAIELQSARGPRAGARSRNPDFRLDTSIVRTIAGPVDVTLVLNRVADERTIWSMRVRSTEAEIPEFAAIEPVIAQIGGDYGIIVQDQLQRQPANFAPGFPCIAQYNHMRQMRTKDPKLRVEQCLRRSLKREPSNATLLNALSLVRFSHWQPQRTTPAGKAAFVEAQDLAQRAYESGPQTSAGLFALARAKFYAGDCRQGDQIGAAAIARNPYDADMIGYFGLFDMACGAMERGETLLRRSIALDASHAGVSAVSLAFVLSQRGKNEEALAILDKMPAPNNMEPQHVMVRTIVVARLGDMAQARRLWAGLVKFTGQKPDAAPETVLRQFMITPTVIQRAAAALRQTGVAEAPPPPPPS